MAWLLVASVGAAARAAGPGAPRPQLRGPLGAQPAGRAARAHAPAAASLAVAGVAVFFLVALGDPGVRGRQRLAARRLRRLVQHHASSTTARSSTTPSLLGPLERSLEYGALVASFTVVAGFVAARLLTRPRTRATRLLDFLLLAAVALPSVVFAAGYILAYNLPILSRVGLDLYQTTTLLLIAYAASSLPTNARVLVGPVSQLQASLHHAARAHGAGALAGLAPGRPAADLASRS